MTITTTTTQPAPDFDAVRKILDDARTELASLEGETRTDLVLAWDHGLCVEVRFDGLRSTTALMSPEKCATYNPDWPTIANGNGTRATPFVRAVIAAKVADVHRDLVARCEAFLRDNGQPIA